MPILGFLTSLPGKIVMGVVLLGLVYGVGQWNGRTAATANAKMAAAEETARILKKRGVLDENVSNRDAADLCRSYGLPDNQIEECMRRLVEAHAVTGNSGADNPQ